MGGGDGRKVATVIGAVGGAMLGNTQAEVPAWRSGDKVKVVNGVIQSNS